MVVHGDREGLLRRILSDDVLVEEVEDLPRLGQFELGMVGRRLAQLLFDDLVAQADAFIADVHPRSGDELPNLLL